MRLLHILKARRQETLECAGAGISKAIENSESLALRPSFSVKAPLLGEDLRLNDSKGRQVTMSFRMEKK